LTAGSSSNNSARSPVEEAYLEAIHAHEKGDLDKTISALQNVLSIDPVHIGALELTGIILLKNDNAMAAHRTLQAVAKFKPIDITAQLRLADAAEQAGEESDAKKALQRAVVVQPQASMALLKTVNFFARRGCIAEASLHAGRNIFAGNLTSTAFSIRARLQAEDNNNGSVYNDLRRALLVMPESGGDLLPVAQITEQMNDLTGAERIYRRFCKIFSPKEPQGWGGYHDLLRKRHRTKEAELQLMRALILAPAEPVLWGRTQGMILNAIPPIFSATASVVCDSENSRAWMRLLLILGSDPRLSHYTKRAAEALRRVNLYARRSPITRFTFAELAYVNGTREEAGEQLQIFFQEVMEGLESRDPKMDHDFGCLVFLYFLLFFGDIDECKYFAGLIDSEFGGQVNNQIHLKKIQLTLDLVLAYQVKPFKWSSDKRRVVSLPVWGAKYVDMWLRYGLPSLFGNENRQFWESGETVFHIATTPDDWQRLNENQLFQKFCKHHNPQFIDITPILKSGIETPWYHALTLSHWVSIFIARDENADFIGLVADYIFSDGSMTFLAERVERANMQAAFTVDFWVAGETAGPSFDRLYANDGSLSISTHEMLQIYGENMSARIHFNETGAHMQSIPSNPSRMYYRLSNGLRIDNLQPQLFFATSDVLQGLWFNGLPMTDNGLIDLVFTAIGNLDTSEMLVDPTRFGCIVLDYDEEERAKTGHYPERIHSLEPVANLAQQIVQRKLWSPGRKWALENPLYVSFDETAPDQVDADSFMNAVSSLLPEPHISGYQAMVKDIGRQEFKSWLERRKSIH